MSRSSASGVDEDAAITTHDFYLGPAAGTTERDSFRAAAKTATDAYCATLAAMMRGVYIFDQYRWYDLADNGTLFGEPFQVDQVNIVGSENTTSALPPQCAMSVTERTALRKAWGRFYIPGLTTSSIDAYGRWTSGRLDQVANAVDTWYTACDAAGGEPVVLHRAIPPETAWAPNPITLIQIDDVVDVIRRRRFEQTNLRVQRAW